MFSLGFFLFAHTQLSHVFSRFLSFCTHSRSFFACTCAWVSILFLFPLEAWELTGMAVRPFPLLPLFPSSPLPLFPSSPLPLFPSSPLPLFPSSPLPLFPSSPLPLFPSYFPLGFSRHKINRPNTIPNHQHDMSSLRTQAINRFHRVADHFQEHEPRYSRKNYNRPALIRFTFEYARSSESQDRFLSAFFHRLRLGMADGDGDINLDNDLCSLLFAFAEDLMNHFFIPCQLSIFCLVSLSNSCFHSTSRRGSAHTSTHPFPRCHAARNTRGARQDTSGCLAQHLSCP
ncbi:hypothetical protein B0T25DRAFT_57544 [Lasiosphaeria hispida]|uniref:Uncharacterized protein n=1 Tax=Lasiosphaeria hispida TaxID=260671 RepID=A0AAJ0HWU6_9PEZI|nr:hypothetical protein B0T25DRAFT_57544 [Lasiosphaeria hispida]